MKLTNAVEFVFGFWQPFNLMASAPENAEAFAVAATTATIIARHLYKMSIISQSGPIGN